jgi:hypothetical protein
MDVFALTPESRAFFRAAARRAADELGSFRSRRMQILLRALEIDGGPSEVPVPDEGWGRLAEVIRSDRPLPMPMRAAEYHAYHFYLASAGREPAQKLAPLLVEWAQPKTLLDLGGGLGTYARAFVEAGGASAVVLDRQEVPPAPLDGVEFVRGDIFAAEGAFGVVLLCNVLHLYGAEECAELCARARRLGGVAVVKDFDPETPAGAWFSLNMALYTALGQVHEVEKIQAWLGGGTVEKMGDHVVVRSP